MRGWKFGAGCEAEGVLVGVGIAGRPLARMLDDGRTLEVLRVCTTGQRNACSLLYGALRKAGRALGYQRVITYTLAKESGHSLIVVGARQVATVKAATWDCPGRPRNSRHEPAERIRWEL